MEPIFGNIVIIIFLILFVIVISRGEKQSRQKNERVRMNVVQTNNKIDEVCSEYIRKYELNEKTAVRIKEGDITYFVSKQSLHIVDTIQIRKLQESWSIMDPNEFNEKLASGEINSSRIEISDIIWFRRDGNIDTNAIVSGVGGGSSIGGAIVGGVLLGGAGAVIGSRKEVQISTDLQTSDNRTVIIHYKDGDIGQDLIFKNDAIYNALVSIIPEKEISNYLKSINQSSNQVIKDNHHEKLRQLKGLYEEGLITETDYSKKKNEIINSL